jgi:hypothetical protein
MEKSGNEIDRYRHPIYIGCACIYLTSMLLAKRRNRYGRLIRTGVHISCAPVLYLGAGAASGNLNHMDKATRH